MEFLDSGAWTMTLDLQPCVDGWDRSLTDQGADPAPPTFIHWPLGFSHRHLAFGEHRGKGGPWWPSQRTAQGQGQPHAPARGGCCGHRAADNKGLGLAAQDPFCGGARQHPRPRQLVPSRS